MVGIKLRTCVLLALVSWIGCDSPTTTRKINLTGSWSGVAKIGWGLDTPLKMELVDINNNIEGNGGGADCRYFIYCRSFGSYRVNGNHGTNRVTLIGTNEYGESWVLRGTIRIDGRSLSGTGSGVSSEFEDFSWQMEMVDKGQTVK